MNTKFVAYMILLGFTLHAIIVAPRSIQKIEHLEKLSSPSAKVEIVNKLPLMNQLHKITPLKESEMELGKGHLSDYDNMAMMFDQGRYFIKLTSTPKVSIDKMEPKRRQRSAYQKTGYIIFSPAPILVE